jgi:hypothetical protein
MLKCCNVIRRDILDNKWPTAAFPKPCSVEPYFARVPWITVIQLKKKIIPEMLQSIKF